MLQHKTIVIKLLKKYRTRLIFAASFWALYGFLFYDLYPSAVLSQKMHKLTQVHNQAVDTINQFLKLGPCHTDFPSDFRLERAASKHKAIGAHSNLHFAPYFNAGKLQLSKIQYSSYFNAVDKKILTNGYLLSYRNSKKCFGIMY